jgi:hypothetical protein
VLVDVHVAVAVPVDHVGDRGALEDGVDERAAATGDQHVDEAAQPHELDGRLAARVLDQHEPVLGQARLGQALAQDGGDRLVRGDGAAAATQEGGVARLEAQAEGVARHVRTVLVDDADDPEGHPDLRDPKAVRPRPAGDHLAHRIRQGGDLAEPHGHRLHPSGVEPQPVDDGRGRPHALGSCDVPGVGLDDVVGPCHEEVGGCQQGGVRASVVVVARTRAAVEARRPSSERGTFGIAAV